MHVIVTLRVNTRNLCTDRLSTHIEGELFALLVGVSLFAVEFGLLPIQKLLACHLAVVARVGYPLTALLVEYQANDFHILAIRSGHLPLLTIQGLHGYTLRRLLHLRRVGEVLLCFSLHRLCSLLTETLYQLFRVMLLHVFKVAHLAEYLTAIVGVHNGIAILCLIHHIYHIIAKDSRG